MQEHEGLSRREFTLASALAMLSGVTITITSCGGGSYSPSTPNPTPAPTPNPTPTPDTGGDKVGSISANHGHIAVIAAAKLAEGGQLTLDIQGNADHPHSVDLSADDMTAIAANQRVSKTSSTDLSHSHMVTFN